MRLAIRLALFALALSAVTRAAERPNILYIMADDLGYGDVSAFNPHSAWQTPHLDRLAHEGIAFTDAHAASSLCTPSRYATLTGRYAWRGILKQGVAPGFGTPIIEPQRQTVANFLRDHGYTTAMLGKWHLGLDWVRTGPKPEEVDFAQPVGGGPTAHGFDRFLGISASLDMPPYVWIHNDRATAIPTARVGDSPAPKLFRAGPIGPDFRMEDVQPRLTGEAIRYVQERGAARDGKPFFLYLALAAPHTPILPTREFDGKTGKTSYGDFVTQVDADVGRILAALEASGLAKNTLVIFTSDNGFAPAANVPLHTSVHHDPSGGWRGYKSDLFEGGHRIPFIARWPGVTTAGRTCADPIEQLDLFATCAQVLDAKLPDNVAEDSISYLALLRGEKPATAPRVGYVSHSGEGRFAITEGRWKLLLWPGSGGWSPPTPHPSQWLKTDATDLATLPPFQLYDLRVDPAEKDNLAAAHPEIVQRLGHLMRATLERGRSTPGAPQPVATTDWPQIAWRNNFAP
jgi:arylsulfatase A-like enzyme